MYDWKESYKNDVVNKTFIKGLLHLLNEGTPYKDVDGNLMGHINSIDGPMDLITVISNIYLESEECEYKRIFVIYHDT